MSIGLYIVLAPLYLKSVRKLQEKRFVFVKILAIIIPENGAKVSKIKCFQFAQQTLNSNQKISKYSKGMTMKLAIAVALSHHPNLLILDEATSGLDPVMREEILDIFLEFVENENHSILLSSHITSDLERIADYITFIHKGKIILTETKDNLIYNYAILRCSDKNFLSLDKEDIVAYRKRDYQIDVLVSDIEKARRKYPKIIIDHTTIDEIMLLLVKGEN